MTTDGRHLPNYLYSASPAYSAVMGVQCSNRACVRGCGDGAGYPIGIVGGANLKARQPIGEIPIVWKRVEQNLGKPRLLRACGRVISVTHVPFFVFKPLSAWMPNTHILKWARQLPVWDERNLWNLDPVSDLAPSRITKGKLNTSEYSPWR